MTGDAPVSPARLHRRVSDLLRRRFTRRRNALRDSWTVCATVDEPTELLCAFVAHYLHLGAREVVLYLDSPRPDQIALLRGIAGVRLVACTRWHWLRMGRWRRPVLHVTRQVLNATQAYRRCRSDWFLCCDADEFLWPDRPMAAVLVEQSAATPFLRIGMAERVFAAEAPPVGIFDGGFRRGSGRAALLDSIYGAQAAFLNSGLTGDVAGKCLTRCGFDARIWLHHPVPRGLTRADPGVRAMAKAPFTPGLRLLHFDGLTPLHWRVKLLRKLMRGTGPLPGDALRRNAPGRPPGRRAQIEAVFRARGQAAALDGLDGLQILTRQQRRALQQAGLMVEAQPRLAQAALALFPDAGLDFSVARFDERLRALYPDAVAQLQAPD